MVGIHSSDQIDLTIPTNCDNVYTVIDQLLRMHRGDIEEAKIRKESGQEDDLLGLSSTIFGANSNINNSETKEDKSGSSSSNTEEIPEQSSQWF